MSTAPGQFPQTRTRRKAPGPESAFAHGQPWHFLLDAGALLAKRCVNVCLGLEPVPVLEG